MTKHVLLLSLALTAAGWSGGLGYALGPVDGEVTAVYWKHDAKLDDGTAEQSKDASNPGLSAEIWLLNRWGVKATAYRSDLKDFDGDTAKSFNATLYYRVVAPTDKSYLAVGAGWQKLDLGSGSDSSSSGVRIAAAGEVGFAGIVMLYGDAGYWPRMGDFSGSSDVKGHDVELGIKLEPAPFLTLKAGYRLQKVDFDIDGAKTSGSIEDKGFLVGAGVHW